MEPDVERIVELACLAPSVHNTQPWLWRAADRTLELVADRSRVLPAADPESRNLVISCGAALHHAQAAARALGWRAEVTRRPTGTGPDVMARVELSAMKVPGDAEEQLRAMRTRCTDRRRFTAWPIPAERLHALATAARMWGATAVAITDAPDRVRVELLASRALDQQRSNAAVICEQRSWVDHGRFDGIPATAVPAPEEQSGLPDRFNVPVVESADRELVEASDGLLVLGGASDDDLAWLQTGEALSALWLDATLGGLAVVPLSHVIEVDETRTALRATLLGGLTAPHLLIRIGWQPIGRRELERTPRRPLCDVLAVADARPLLSGTFVPQVCAARP
jgi:hypothetical protein